MLPDEVFEFETSAFADGTIEVIGGGVLFVLFQLLGFRVVEVECCTSCEEFDVVGVVFLFGASSDGLTDLFATLRHGFPIDRVGAQHVEALVSAAHGGVVVVEHHGHLRIEGEFVAGGNDLLGVEFVAGGGFEIEIGREQGGTEIRIAQNVDRPAIHALSGARNGLRNDGNGRSARTAEDRPEDKHLGRAVLRRFGELREETLQLVVHRTLGSFEDGVVHHHRAEVSLCAIAVAEVEFLHLFGEHQVGQIGLFAVVVLRSAVVKHLLEGAFHIIVGAELIILHVGREEGVFKRRARGGIAAFGAAVGLFHFLEAGEVTVVFIGIEGKEVEFGVVEHAHSAEVQERFDATHARSTDAENEKLIHSILFLEVEDGAELRIGSHQSEEDKQHDVTHGKRP